MKRCLPLLLCLLLASEGALAQASRSSRQEPLEADRIVAVVNDEVITLHELHSRLDSALSQLKRQGTPLPPQEVLERQMLDRMVTDKVQVQFAKENGIRIEDAQLDMALNRIAANNNLSLDAFRRALEKDGIPFVKFREEIRQEMKESDGNPEIKGKIRQLQQERARQRMMQEVPKADVVITNPTHYAVAIRYEVNSMGVPVVVAKGKNYLALRIRELARKNQVPVIENPPLAQALYKSVEVGQEIPAHLYRAVAEILAYLYRVLNGKLPG